MRTAIYIEDGVVQLVLTPENGFEKNALGSFENQPLSATIKVGQFYDCCGGWTRHRNTSRYGDFGYESEDRSLIIRLDHQKVSEGEVVG